MTTRDTKMYLVFVCLNRRLGDSLEAAISSKDGTSSISRPNKKKKNNYDVRGLQKKQCLQADT